MAEGTIYQCSQPVAGQTRHASPERECIDSQSYIQALLDSPSSHGVIDSTSVGQVESSDARSTADLEILQDLFHQVPREQFIAHILKEDDTYLEFTRHSIFTILKKCRKNANPPVRVTPCNISLHMIFTNLCAY